MKLSQSYAFYARHLFEIRRSLFCEKNKNNFQTIEIKGVNYIKINYLKYLNKVYFISFIKEHFIL